MFDSDEEYEMPEPKKRLVKRQSTPVKSKPKDELKTKDEPKQKTKRMRVTRVSKSDRDETERKLCSKFHELLEQFKAQEDIHKAVDELDFVDMCGTDDLVYEDVRFEHNRKMLVASYLAKKTGTSLPRCCNAESKGVDQCAAYGVRIGQRTPLVMFLTPTELEVFDETGSLPVSKGPCLLCVRRACKKEFVVRLATNNTNTTGFVLTIRNYCDIDGGYKRECMIPCFPAVGDVSKIQFGIVDYEPEKLEWEMVDGVMCISEKNIMFFRRPEPQQHQQGF